MTLRPEWRLNWCKRIIIWITITIDILFRVRTFTYAINHGNEVFKYYYVFFVISVIFVEILYYVIIMSLSIEFRKEIMNTILFNIFMLLGSIISVSPVIITTINRKGKYYIKINGLIFEIISRLIINSIAIIIIVIFDKNSDQISIEIFIYCIVSLLFILLCYLVYIIFIEELTNYRCAISVDLENMQKDAHKIPSEPNSPDSPNESNNDPKFDLE